MFDSRYSKIASILKIKNQGLNIHNTVISEKVEEILKVAKDYGMFTIRTDRVTKWEKGWEGKSEFPFIVQDTPTNNYEQLENKLNQLVSEGFVFIISDGIKYDKIQDYNAVAILKVNGDFRIEASTEKVPLRYMYKRGNIFIAEGNITDKLRDIQFYGTVNFDKKAILQDIQYLYTKEIFNKWIEFTRYPIRVGINNEKFVFWQIRDK